MPRTTDDESAKAAVLKANAEFYRAFSTQDARAMRALWAERAPIACLHPMAQALVGRGAVIQSWDDIFGQSSRFELRCEHPVALLLGEVAVVLCYEGATDEPAHLAATNIFVLEEERWRMVHHHAGPLSSPLAKPPDRSMIN
jgi:ketosteroid isomerase-like protein